MFSITINNCCKVQKTPIYGSMIPLKEQIICNVYSIIPEAWNIQACKCLTVLWHTHGDAADMEQYSRVFWQQGCHSRLF